MSSNWCDTKIKKRKSKSNPCQDLQGVQKQKCLFNLAVTERNMQVRFYLKVVLKFWEVRQNNEMFHPAFLNILKEPLLIEKKHFALGHSVQHKSALHHPVCIKTWVEFWAQVQWWGCSERVFLLWKHSASVGF